MKIKPWTQRLRDNREANDALDPLMPPTRREIETALREEITELRAALNVAQQVAVPQVARKYICPVVTVADLANNLLLMDPVLPIYGAQYIDHPTRGRCAIAVPPTVSRERVQDSRWIGQGNELNAAVVWTRAAQDVNTELVEAVEGLLNTPNDDSPESVASCILYQGRVRRAIANAKAAPAPQPPQAVNVVLMGALEMVITMVKRNAPELNGKVLGYAEIALANAKAVPPQVERTGLVDAAEFLIDVLDDAKNPEEHRTYVGGSYDAAISAIRAVLAATPQAERVPAADLTDAEIDTIRPSIKDDDIRQFNGARRNFARAVIAAQKAKP